MDNSNTTPQEICIANHNANKLMPIIGHEVIIDIHLARDELPTLSRNNLSTCKYLLTSQIVCHLNVHVKWTICKHLTIANLST
jgi:hypothetical protein